jgi:hypothetical protein
MAQLPQTSSRQLESYEMGVVFLPAQVMGFSAMSRKQMITFIAGRQASANSSQYGAPCGLTCRLIFTMTCFSAIVLAKPLTLRSFARLRRTQDDHAGGMVISRRRICAGAE